jgi:hypothetical protein
MNSVELDSKDLEAIMDELSISDEEEDIEEC